MKAKRTAASTTTFASFNARLAAETLTRFIRDEVTKVGFERVVLGLSGGLDSAVVAHLAARALGPANTLCVMMPYRTSAPSSLRDAQTIVDALGTESLKIDISPVVDAYLETHPSADRIRCGNIMTRSRMMALYDHSARSHGLVLGTSNKTELLVGYGTLFGDMASAMAPIGDLYKTEVRLLAKYLDVPRSIIEKTPSADLWADQSDERELGFTYDELDLLLVELVDKRIPPDWLAEHGYDPVRVERVVEMIRSSQFKRRPPLIPKVSTRSVNHDFLYKRDWGK